MCGEHRGPALALFRQEVAAGVGVLEADAYPTQRTPPIAKRITFRVTGGSVITGCGEYRNGDEFTLAGEEASEFAKSYAGTLVEIMRPKRLRERAEA
jgi:hypothetical protein